MENVKPTKRGRGRPQVYQEPMERGSYRLPTTVVEVIKTAGGGNVTHGLMRLAKMWYEKNENGEK